MQKAACILVLTLVAKLSFGQNTRSISSSFDLDSSDTQNIYSLLGIDVSKFYLSNKYKGFYCNYVVEEYYKGQKQKAYSLMDSLPALLHQSLFVGNKLNSANQFPIRLYSQQTDTILKVQTDVGFGGVRSINKLSLRKGLSYSFKEVYDLNAGKKEPIADSLFPLLTFTSPVGSKSSNLQTESVGEFCKISGEKISPENWFKELGIEHYFLFPLY
jgi:hypothetical protein